MKSGQAFVCRETMLLLAICLLDMLSSAYLFQHRMAIEANPLLRPFADAGVMSFVVAKAATFIPALVVAEWYRRQRPDFVLPLIRWAAGIYAGIYALLVGLQFLG